MSYIFLKAAIIFFSSFCLRSCSPTPYYFARLTYTKEKKKLHCLLVWRLFAFSFLLLYRTVFMSSLKQTIKEYHYLFILMLIIQTFQPSLITSLCCFESIFRLPSFFFWLFFKHPLVFLHLK